MKQYRNIFIFTGQGSQHPGMGRSFYETEPVFRQWMDDLDRVPRRKLSISVVDALYGSGNAASMGTADPLDRTTVSHPALFMVQYALARTLMDAGIYPDCLFGASLGEYVAMAVAEVMPPHAILSALVDNAHILEICCPPGTMIGVSDAIWRFENEPELNAHTSLAGIISPRQFVLSGDLPGITRAVRHLEKKRRTFQHLPIRFGFHSPNIDPAAGAWKKRVATIADEAGGLNRPSIDMISCCLASFVIRPDVSFFWEIGRGPILFRRALQTLKEELDRQAEPLSSKPIVNLIDLGPGSHSSGFIRQNALLGKQIRTHRMMTLFNHDLRNLTKLKANLIPQ
ncbi:MAG: acyltransferase domain-containing protein [Desulfobacterales bacterium]|nr:acyltransferase domain-containing protein [Desulfobacterales bacterium]